MLLALVIVCIAIQTYYWAIKLRDTSFMKNTNKGFTWITLISLAILVIQVVFGTDVREIIDHLNQQGIQRSEWIDSIGLPYITHRFLAYVTLALSVFLYFKIRSSELINTLQFKYAKISLVLVCIQMLSGIILARFHVPAVAQTVHLVIASLLVGSQYYLLLILNKPEKALSTTV